MKEVVDVECFLKVLNNSKNKQYMTSIRAKKIKNLIKTKKTKNLKFQKKVKMRKN